MIFALIMCMGFLDDPEEVALRGVEITVATPTPSYSLYVMEIRRIDDGKSSELWAWCVLNKPTGQVSQTAGVATDKLSLLTPNLPMKYIVSGKGGKWENKEKHIFLDQIGEKQAKEMKEKFLGGDLIFMIGKGIGAK